MRERRSDKIAPHPVLEDARRIESRRLTFVFLAIAKCHYEALLILRLGHGGDL